LPGIVERAEGKETMSETNNTQLIQDSYEALKTGEVDSLLKSFTDDVLWQLPEMENVPFSGTWQGHDGVRKFFETVFRLQDVLEFEPREFIAQRDTVVVLGHFIMRIKSTGKEFSSDWAHVWNVKDGKVTRFYEYVDTAVVSRAHTAAKKAGRTG
jgi:ketosteroid isomerase-like protein